MVRILKLPENRLLFLSPLGEPTDFAVESPFAALLPAFSERERAASAAVSQLLLAKGCVEFCCLGPEAEILHDALDEVVERAGALDVVTTWHTDEVEAVEYFVLAAGGMPSTLVALVALHSTVVAQLEAYCA